MKICEAWKRKRDNQRITTKRLEIDNMTDQRFFVISRQGPLHCPYLRYPS